MRLYQYEMETIFGKIITSAGIKGVALQGTWPNNAIVIRVKTLQCAAPP